ncbi:hypothetical protein D9M68_270960 [compost metagenome]
MRSCDAAAHQRVDACNLFGDVATVKAKLDILKQHCDTLKRDYATIEKTTLGTVHIAPGQLSVKDVIAQCKALADVGVDQALFNLPNVHEIKPLEIFGKEIIPAVAGF